jgi:pyridoxal phosphate enzyme (YggS family)
MTLPVAKSLDEQVAFNLAAVRARIAAAGGDPDVVRVVAVTKTFPAAAVLAALHAGLRDIGENYADELVDKASALSTLDEGPRWHFLGALQRNKLARLAPVVSCYQGVDRLAEGEAIARRRPGASVMVEIDTAGTPGRGGLPPVEAPALVAALRGLELDVAGLMTVAPPDEQAARRAFSLVGSLRVELGLAEASMGMSGDLELAVEAGTTMVRIGSSLFGPRAPQIPVSQ